MTAHARAADKGLFAYGSKLKPAILCVGFLASISLLISFSGELRTSATAQTNQTQQEKRGKEIYLKGGSADGREVLAYVGDSSLELPGTAMPCVNCHGQSGRGKPEGGVIPSEVTWEALTKPYDVTHPSGRKHGPYTERALELAITRGLDPSGNKLAPVMPRYQMSPADLADLIAYIKRLGLDHERGISDNSITIGMLLPSQGQLGDLGDAVKAVTIAFFQELNDHGGVYNRKINLKFVATGTNAQETVAITRRFIQDEGVFALSSPFIAGADAEIAAVMKELEVPAVAPLTLQPKVSHPLNRYVFYLLAGLDSQAQVLVSFASHQSSALKAGALILSPDNSTNEDLVNAVKDQCSRDGCGPIEQIRYPRALEAAALAEKLRNTRKEVIFFLGSDDEALALAREADKLQWVPTFYFPGGVGARNLFDAPHSFGNKFLISLPTSPSDQTPQGLAEFRGLASKYNLPSNHLASQILALSAAKILSEGLRQSGRELTAENLIIALERLNEYQTGLTPPISYGPNRRLGASGAHVVVLDLEKRAYVPVGPWVKMNLN